MNRFFKLLFLLCLTAIPARAFVTNVEVRVTFTNQIASRGATTNGDTITIQGDVRRYTNGTLNAAATWIQSTNILGYAATNTQIHLATYGVTGIDRVFSTNTNAIIIVSRLGVFPVVTLSSGVGEVTYATNVWSESKPVTFPLAAAPTEIARTNIVNGLIEVLTDSGNRASNGLPSGVKSLSNYLDRASYQPSTNKTFYSTTNQGGLADGIRITNAIAIWGSNGTLTAITLLGATNSGFISSLTNGTLYSNTLHWARITNVVGLAGTVAILKDGVWTNAVLDRGIATNFVNYGNAIRSEGPGGNSFQMGSNAVASGARAVSLGNNSTASGADDVSIGTDSSATGSTGVAIGNSAIAFGASSVAIGQQSRATNYSVGIGYNANWIGVPAPSSVAVGYLSTAAGDSSISVGYLSASGSEPNSIAIGNQANANEHSSIAFGDFAVSSFSNSAAIGPTDHDGNFVSTTTTNQIRLGTSAHVVSAPGFIQGTLSNLVTASGQTNRLEGDLSTPRATVTTIANGANTFSMGTNILLDLTGSPSGAWTVDGISFAGKAARDGHQLLLKNSTGYDATFTHNSGLEPTAAYRISTFSSTNVIFTNGATAHLIYFASSARWILWNVFNGFVQPLTATATNAIGSISTNGSSLAFVGNQLTNIQWNTGVTGYLSGATAILGVNVTGGASLTGTTNYLFLKPTAAKLASTNSAYPDNTLQSGFLAFPHTNGAGTVTELSATFDQLTLPADYNTNTLAFDFGVMNTATNGPNASNFVFIAEVLRHNHTGQTSTNDAQVGPFDAGRSAFTVTVAASFNGTNKVQWVSGTISNCTLAANESFSLRLQRANTNSADLVGSGVAGVTSARLRYTRP